MRMKSALARLRREESGAFAIIFALCLIALIGMMVLVVDVGGLLYQRRQMVSASDAAALAAAQSCALGVTVAGDPAAKADAIASTNLPSSVGVSGGIVQAESTGCLTNDEGHVTVQYQSQHALWFAGIFGNGPVNITTKATAEWGPAASGWPVPFIVTLDSAGNVFCKDGNGNPVEINDQTPKGTVCSVWFDNSSSGGQFGGFGGSIFGSLNLNEWNVDQNANCGSKDLPDNSDYASLGGYDNRNGPLDPLNYPDPTWVCVGPGDQDSLYSALEDSIGKNLVFPITDKTVILDNAGNIDKFNVIGYVSLHLDDVIDANSIPGPGTCSHDRQFSQGGTVDLATFGNFFGCFTGTPQSMGPPTLNKSGPGPQCCTLNTDYTYDASTHTITWIANRTQNVNVSFPYQFSGPCGPPPNNSSAHCLIVSWQEAQLGNGPLGGNNVGVPAVRLCDPTIVGSCDTLS
jgi:Flp pilus assembly protein TadG